MKFLLVLCFIALVRGEDESLAEQSQQLDNVPTTKPTLPPQSNPQFTNPVYPSPPLNFLNKDQAPASGPVTFPAFVGNIPQYQAIQPIQSIQPVQPVQPVGQDFFVGNQGVTNTPLPNFIQVPRSGIPTAGVVNTIQPSFGGGVFPQAVPSVINGFVGPHFNGLMGGVLPNYPGIQGVPVTNLNGNSPNVALPTLPNTHYRILPQQAFNFANQGLHQAQSIVPQALSTIPSFPNNLLPSVPSSVFPVSQGVLKNPSTEANHPTVNIPNIPNVPNLPNIPSGNIGSDSSNGVFRRP